MANALMYLMGGGTGTRLQPLTSQRAKPAVPFGGTLRVVDFVLSNIYNSGIRTAAVLTQYKSKSLHGHLRGGWYHRFGMGEMGSILTLPAAKGETGWFQGTADAVYQNLDVLERQSFDVINVFGADHVYLMDISQMNQFHLDNDADMTISAIPVRRDLAAGEYGVFTVNQRGEMIAFTEKPKDPSPIPGNEDFCLCSMGNYALDQKTLEDYLRADAKKVHTDDKEKVLAEPEMFTKSDFGFDIIPALMRDGKKIMVYDFSTNTIPGMAAEHKGYWRDIGNLDQFYIANMEIREVNPPINLYNRRWRIHTNVEVEQPAKFIGNNTKDNLVANGAVLTNSNIERSVISYGDKVDNAYVTDSILLGYTTIMPGARIHRAIIDRDVVVPSGIRIGIDHEEDIAHGFKVTEAGITVVPKKYKF
ncbi:glucose-1-phosphate adenylyltransferase [Candidatus Woesearchaeota archaeon]|nr:glucose-1-phosphate adenylyltransferase [Candidatus Woesearchaeota archaeon]